MSMDHSFSGSLSGKSFFGSSRSGTSSRVIVHSKAFLADLIERMRPQLKNVARHHTQNLPNCKDDASDIVQLSAIKAMEHMDQLEGQTSGQCQAWLVQIVRNQAKDRQRYWTQEKRAYRAEEHDSKLIDRIADRSLQTPSKIVDTQEARQIADAALASLTIDNQQLVRWRLVEGATYKVIAKKLQVTEPTARKKCRGALIEFRKTAERLGA